MPGTAYTFQASGAFSGGDLVGMTGPLTVAKVTSSASLAYVGVAGTDAAVGQKATIHMAKAVHDSVAEGTITPGDQLVSSSVANRQVKALAASASNVDVTATPNETTIEQFNAAINTAVNNSRGVIGTAVTAATDNQTVRWVQR
ncbi:MAG TPA: hypothetical protein VES42_16300 [Pilimelia sp.]|nr:hypothetical protein [Pilimelia sp.]